jgi:hypothetical protein
MNSETELTATRVEPIVSPLRMSCGVFELTCDRSDWLGEYAEHHSWRINEGVGFFHLHEWLTERGVVSSHRVIWVGFFSFDVWLVAHVAFWLFPVCKKRGQTKCFYG